MREYDPVRMVWHDLKNSARKRNLEFALPLDWFRTFIAGTEYMEKRGRGPDDLTIDRIREEEGYIVGNIQVIPKKNNVEKFHLHYGRRKSIYTWRKNTPLIKDANDPF